MNWWWSQDYVTIRDAIVRTADRMTPKLGIIKYTSMPWPPAPKDDPLGRIMLDPVFSFRGAADTEWQVLLGARQALTQALRTGRLVVFHLTTDGSMEPLPMERWRPLAASADIEMPQRIARDVEERLLIRKEWLESWLESLPGVAASTSAALTSEIKSITDAPPKRGRGRPTGQPLVSAEMKKRADQGELEATVTAEATYLSLWLQKTHGDKPDMQMTMQSIRNVLGKEYSALKRVVK